MQRMDRPRKRGREGRRENEKERGRGGEREREQVSKSINHEGSMPVFPCPSCPLHRSVLADSQSESSSSTV